MADFNLIIPITKVDEDKRLVYGLVTEEIVDQAGEIFDYDSSKPLWEEWSNRISKATGGKSVGNMRLMHQPIVAGKLTELHFDDENKRISCCGKVVDDESWNLVVEGCLSGFSMGGNYVRRWTDPDNKKAKRFTARPVEVSIVDNPAVTTATFEYLKCDGSIEIRKFHSAGDGQQGDDDMDPTQEQIAEKAAELAKAAGTPDAVDQFLEEAKTLLIGQAEIDKAAAGEAPTGEAVEQEEIEQPEGEAPVVEKGADGEGEGQTEAELATAALEAQRADVAKTLVQVWQAPDGRTSAKKGDLVETLIAAPTIETPPAPEESPVEKALRLAREAAEAPGEPAPELADLAAQLDAVHKGLVAANENLAPLTKGLYEVRQLASLLQEMSYLVSCTRDEALREGDNSPVPAQLFTALRQMGATLVTMAQEEVAEMLSILGAGSDWADAAVPVDEAIIAIVELSALVDMTKANEPVMTKAGARNSGSDMSRIQTIHDAAVELDAKCADGETGKAAKPGEIEAEEGDVVKALRAENAGLKSEVDKAVEGITDLGGQIAAMREELETLKKTPETLPPRTNHVVMERLGKSEEITQEVIEKMSPEQRADLAIRISHLAPKHALPA